MNQERPQGLAKLGLTIFKSAAASLAVHLLIVYHLKSHRWHELLYAVGLARWQLLCVILIMPWFTWAPIFVVDQPHEIQDPCYLPLAFHAHASHSLFLLTWRCDQAMLGQ